MDAKFKVLCIGVIVVSCLSQADLGIAVEQKQTSLSVNDSVYFKGVNLAGAEFTSDGEGNGEFPGIHGTHYVYPDPTHAGGYNSATYYMEKGANLFRIPFRWERMQPTRNAPLDAVELGRLKTTVDRLLEQGAAVIIDPHNYARYKKDVIGSAAVPTSDFVDFWTRLSSEFKDSPNVIFGLCNEPHDLPTSQWIAAADAAIQAIRNEDANNLILVQGNGWASSWWFENSVEANQLLTLDDPIDNLAFEVHIYLDSNDSGTYETCVSDTIGEERAAIFTDWLRTHQQKGFIGEIGGSANQTCLNAIDNAIDHIELNRDVYLGWAWWAGGPWWGEYFMSLEPSGDQDKPQMDILEPHYAFNSGPSCSDNLQNQEESDVDCGGPNCAGCQGGKICIVDTDCLSNDCVNGVCTAVPSCDDGIQNQEESDVDCGGPNCAGCQSGKICIVDTDCQSGNCSDSGTCEPAITGVEAIIGLQNEWNVGYCADVVVSNTGADTVSTWTVVIDTHESSINQSWQSHFEGNGVLYTITPVDGNSTIPPGGSQSFGFCADKTGENWMPEVISAE